jgi:hypothetical protein
MTLYASEKLKYTISQSSFPSTFPLVLNTDFADGFVPGIVATFGSGVPITIELDTIGSPSVIFKKD